jgi:hypothetical protein
VSVQPQKRGKQAGGGRGAAADVDVPVTSPRQEEGRGTSPVASPTLECRVSPYLLK